MGAGCSRVWLAMLTLALAAGCHKTFRGKATQPNPLAIPTETLRVSETISIITSDMELNVPVAVASAGGNAQFFSNRKYRLRNEASFTVVSRDRLRFHVQIEHKWIEYVNLSNWSAYLVDDRGRRYRPESIDKTQDEHVVMMWDREVRTVGHQYRGGFGRIISVREDGYKNRQTLGNLSVFRGRGDIVFYRRDIFTPQVKSLTLVVERRGLAFAFTWNFVDQDEPGPAGPEPAPTP